MNCINCGNKVNVDTIKCPFCGHCNTNDESKITSFGSKLFKGIVLLFSLGPFMIAFIIMALVFAVGNHLININKLVGIIKAIIYLIICIPLFLAILGYANKIFKTNSKKEKICLVLSIISIVGLTSFYTFTKNFKIQFNDYDKQEFITLNDIYVPTLYKATNYNDTLLAMKLSGYEDGIKAEEITIQTNEPIPNNILNEYKNTILTNGYTYFGILDGETEGYIYNNKNNYYMLIGFLDNNKTIIYLSFDQANYDKFISNVSLTQ